MLRIYTHVVQLVASVRPLVEAIERRDSSLGSQLRRALSSVPLNIAEGWGCAGGNRRLRYLTALGSARETLACLHVAEAFGYIAPVGPGLTMDLDRAIGTLVKLARR